MGKDLEGNDRCLIDVSSLHLLTLRKATIFPVNIFGFPSENQTRHVQHTSVQRSATVVSSFYASVYTNVLFKGGIKCQVSIALVWMIE